MDFGDNFAARATGSHWQQQSRRRVRRWLQGISVGTILLFALLHVTTGTLQKPSHAFNGRVLVSPDDPHN